MKHFSLRKLFIVSAVVLAAGAMLYSATFAAMSPSAPIAALGQRPGSADVELGLSPNRAVVSAVAKADCDGSWVQRDHRAVWVARCMGVH